MGGEAPDTLAGAPAEQEVAFRRAMSRHPTGVGVITSIGPSGPSGMTANAFTSLSLRPLLMLVCFDRDSRTLVSVRHSGRFGVNVLAADQQEVARRFAGKEDEASQWSDLAYAEEGGAPRIEGAVTWVGCDLERTVDGGDHEIAIGRVTAIRDREAAPLVFYEGEFRHLS